MSLLKSLKRRIQSKHYTYYQKILKSDFFRKSSAAVKIPNDVKVSIVMPSFNQAEFLERSILSVLNQSYENIELIIIDGGSTDGSVDLIRKYENSLAYWISEPDQGQSHALNKGFSKASGEIFGWLNSDDLYLPGAIECIVDKFKDEKNQVVYGNTLSIDQNDSLLDVKFSFPFTQHQLIKEGFVAVTQSFFWSAELHQSIEFDESLFIAMDSDLYLQVDSIYPITQWTYINEFLGVFRHHIAQKTSDRYAELSRAEADLLEEKYDIKINDSIGYKLIYNTKRFFYQIWLPIVGPKNSSYCNGF